MSEKTIRVCDDCGTNLEKIPYGTYNGFDICAKCQQKFLETYYKKSANLANRKCAACNGNGTSCISFSKDKAFSIGICLECYGRGYIRERSSCEKCNGSGTIELSCGLTNKCECNRIL